MSTKPIAFCAWGDSRILLIDTLQRSPVNEPPNTKHSSTNITYSAIGRGLITESILRQRRDHSNSIIASISEVDPGACFLNGDQGTVKYRGSRPQTLSGDPGSMMSRYLSAMRTHSGREWKRVGGSAYRRVGDRGKRIGENRVSAISDGER